MNIMERNLQVGILPSGPPAQISVLLMEVRWKSEKCISWFSKSGETSANMCVFLVHVSETWPD